MSWIVTALFVALNISVTTQELQALLFLFWKVPASHNLERSEGLDREIRGVGPMVKSLKADIH